MAYILKHRRDLYNRYDHKGRPEIAAVNSVLLLSNQ
jgi:uncharacterized protein YqeY